MADDYPESFNMDLGFVTCGGGKGSSKNVAYIASRVGLKCAMICDFDALLFDLPLLGEVHTLYGGTTGQLDGIQGRLEAIAPIERLSQEPSVKEAKKSGIDSQLVKESNGLFDSALNTLESAGIFVVPSGSLEAWAPEVEPKV